MQTLIYWLTDLLQCWVFFFFFQKLKNKNKHKVVLHSWFLVLVESSHGLSRTKPVWKRNLNWTDLLQHEILSVWACGLQARKSYQIKSFPINPQVWLLTPYLYLHQDRQALVHYMPSSFLTTEHNCSLSASGFGLLFSGMLCSPPHPTCHLLKIPVWTTNMTPTVFKNQRKKAWRF